MKAVRNMFGAIKVRGIIWYGSVVKWMLRKHPGSLRELSEVREIVTVLEELKCCRRLVGAEPLQGEAIAEALTMKTTNFKANSTNTGM